MLDLKNLGVVEMSSQEQVEIEGGILPWLIIAACLLYSTKAY